MSFHESFHRILDTLPYVSDVGFIQCGIEVSADWFVRYDIKPRGVKSISRMTYWISESDLQDIARERPGAKRAPGVEYRWKEVY